MFAIYKRELKSCFCSFVGFLFVGVILFFLGLYFTVYGLLYGSPYFSNVVNSVLFLFLICVPVLTMRVLAEERRNKTDQLILTAPVSVGAIVTGKFLAMVTVLAVPVAISCIYPLVWTRYGSVPMGENYLCILGFFLYGVACISVGIFVSSLTESQVIAAVLGFAVLFLGYMMKGICGVISSTGNLLTKILGCFDLSTPVDNLLSGTLRVDSVVYYLSLSVLMLFLTVQSIQKRRYSVSVKHFSMGAYSGAAIGIAVAIVVAVNLILGEMPSTWTAIDVTSQKLYSLTDQTKDFLKTLDEDVTIYVIVNQDQEDTLLGETLRRYEDSSDHISVEYVDPAVNPLFYTQYTSQDISINSLILVSDKRSTVVDASDVYESTFDYSTYSSTVTGYDGEGKITSALAYVTTDDVPKMYLTEGHGEAELSDRFNTALEKENVTYEAVNLMEYDEVPEDAACLLINAPEKDFNEDDRDKVIRYLENGGKVIAVTSLVEGDFTNYYGIMEYMGMHVIDGMVVELDRNYYYQSPYLLLPEIHSSSYTSGIYDQYYIMAPYAKGLTIEDENAEGMTYQVLLNTSESSFAKMNPENIDNLEQEEGDISGPFDIAVEAVKTTEITDNSEEGEEDGSGNSTAETKEGTLVAVSCDEIFIDVADQYVSGANSLFFTNIVGSFCEHEVTVSVPVKSYEVSSLLVPQTDIILIGVLVTVVLPVLPLVFGLVFWLRRRKR